MMASRIVTSNLIKDTRIEESFTGSVVATLYNALKEIKENLAHDPIVNKTFNKNSGLWTTEARIFLSTTEQKNIDTLKRSIKGDYLLYACAVGMYDLYVIKNLIESGVKVAMGGGFAATETAPDIRKMFLNLDTDPVALEKNLIIITGFVDLDTDLYTIIKNWKDHYISENNFQSLWDCKVDYVQPFLDMAERMHMKYSNSSIMRYDESQKWKNSYAIFLFDTGCWWNKCKFCVYPFDKEFDIISKVSPEKIIESIIETMKLYKANSILFADRYFSFDDRKRKILKALKDNGIKVGIYTGILKLMDDNYIKDLNKYVQSIFLGLESTSDFALKAINKGYKREHIFKAFNKLALMGKNELTVITNIIFDLPYESYNDIQIHYDTLKQIKSKFDGRDFRFNGKLLIIHPDLKDQLVDGKRIVETDFDDPDVCGRTIVWRMLAEKYNFPKKYYYNFHIPYKRYDVDGNLLVSDLKLINNFHEEVHL